ncbi:hypothetical protein [Sphingobium chungbukense]|uniref:Uncharacterized protein n=1 Tax=Sphingobium chungbukense TaxID=56193 RepID=A0A0M3AVT1_9SPHN|nr:hypothetical protein [Sphingobium chungbukense]KKW93006.1 hypothetical protein YP76_09020 [Sphingobium chungbukense]
MPSMLLRIATLLLPGMMMISSAHAADPDRPVWLDVRTEGNQAVISVLAAWPEKVRVEVDLQIAGASTVHTANRAELRAGAAPVTLSRAAIDARKGWSARLSVQPQGMEPYQISRSSNEEIPAVR